MTVRRYWTEREVAELRALYPDTTTREIAERLGRTEAQVYNKANGMGLRKSEQYLASPAASRLRPGAHIGKASQFKKGNKPWNAGKKGYDPGGRSPETRFKKGARPHTWVPIGTETVDKDGYTKRKVRDDAPPGQSRRNWKFVHVLLWEEKNGPVPKGHAVVFKDGNKRNLRIDNLELVSRRDLMKRNSVHRLPKEWAQIVQLKGALQRQINRRMKGHEKQG